MRRKLTGLDASAFAEATADKRCSTRRDASQRVLDTRPAHLQWVGTRRRRISSHKNRVSAFTLTEVIVASALLIIAMVPILRALTSAHVSSTSIEYKTRSLTLAQAKLDEIKARSIYDYTHGGSSFAESNTSVDGSYLCNVTDNSGDPLKTIAVSVGYDLNGDNTLASDEIKVTLTTYLAKRWTD